MKDFALSLKKEMQLDAVFQQIKKEPECTKMEKTKNGVSNLVLMALQEDKKFIDGWDAFGRVAWGKSF